LNTAEEDAPHAPPAEALRWVERATGEGARVEYVEPLAGATSSVLHAVRVRHGGRSFEFVLRRFLDAGWLESEPDLARHEASALSKAAGAGVPTPRPVAFDESGEECGAPSTLMERLPGGVELRPADFPVWLRRLAEAVAPFHELGAEDFVWSYSPYADLSSLEPPAWSRVPELWEKAIEIVAGPRPPARECFVHRDFHPANVLWSNGRVSGVVDWVNACRGPAGIDVAWCRHNLARMYGVGAAEEFLGCYQERAGTRFAHEPFWDLIALIELLPGPPGVYPGWPAFGLKGLDDATVGERVDEYLSSLMRRC